MNPIRTQTSIALILLCVATGCHSPKPCAILTPPIRQTVVTVAQDGSGQFTNMQDAIMSVPMGYATNPVVIRIKPGTYKEQI